MTELREQLIEDDSLRIMIVEGVSDLALWRALLSIADREGATIYPIDEVHIIDGGGGNRSKCLDLELGTANWPEADRLRFFIDADNAHALAIALPLRVFVTDFRDLEAYCLDDVIFDRVCVTGLSRSAAKKALVRGMVTTLVRPIGLLRAFSEANGLALPFRATFPGFSIERVWSRKAGAMQVNLMSVIIALQNSKVGSAAGAGKIKASFDQYLATCAGMGDDILVHGKDLIAFLAKIYGVDGQVVQGIVRLSLEVSASRLVQFPNMKAAVDWLAP